MTTQTMQVGAYALAAQQQAHTTAAPLGRRIGVLNNKGGVGKTEQTVLLAEAYARRGLRVLAVDMDPQGNLSRRLGVTAADITPTRSIGDILALPVREQRGAASAAIVGCGWDHDIANLIDVIPATTDLSDRDRESGTPGASKRLNRALHEVTDAYDVTIIDCRPTLGLLEQMVVECLGEPGDGVVIPIEPARDAISGAYRIKEVLADWAERLDMNVAILGVIVNMYDGRTRLHRGRAANAAASLVTEESPEEIRVIKPYLPRAIRLSEVADLAIPSTGDQRLQREGLIETIDTIAKEIL